METAKRQLRRIAYGLVAWLIVITLSSAVAALGEVAKVPSIHALLSIAAAVVFIGAILWLTGVGIEKAA